MYFGQSVSFYFLIPTSLPFMHRMVPGKRKVRLRKSYKRFSPVPNLPKTLTVGSSLWEGIRQSKVALAKNKWRCHDDLAVTANDAAPWSRWSRGLANISGSRDALWLQIWLQIKSTLAQWLKLIWKQSFLILHIFFCLSLHFFCVCARPL